MDGKQRCSYDGCRAWARRKSAPEGSHAAKEGGVLCEAHSRKDQRRGAGAPKRNQNARKHGLYISYGPVMAREEARSLPPGDLRVEIAVVRGLLDDLLKTGLPTPELVAVVDVATRSLARLLRTNQRLEADRPDEFDDAVAQVLKKLGLG